METKLSKVKKAYDAGDYQKALSLANKFQDLGEQRDRIKRAHECYVNPRFYAQLGYNIVQTKLDGIAALAERYGWPSHTQSASL